jgi:hypothetical protein
VVARRPTFLLHVYRASLQLHNTYDVSVGGCLTGWRGPGGGTSAQLVPVGSRRLTPSRTRAEPCHVTAQAKPAPAYFPNKLITNEKFSAVRIQGIQKHRIPDPDPQHCLNADLVLLITFMFYAQSWYGCLSRPEPKKRLDPHLGACITLDRQTDFLNSFLSRRTTRIHF